MLKTGRKCTWDEIEVGEVFAWNGCWMVGVKINKLEFMELADDWRSYFEGLFNIGPSNIHTENLWLEGESIYKLPLKTQNLWKTV